MYTCFRCARNLYYVNRFLPSFAEVKVLQQQNMLNVHHMHTWVCTVFNWNYEQHLYTHTLIPIFNRFASTNEPLNKVFLREKKTLVNERLQLNKNDCLLTLYNPSSASKVKKEGFWTYHSNSTLLLRFANHMEWIINYMRMTEVNLFVHKAKTEVPRDVRNSKVQKQDKFRRYWSQH